MRAKRIYKALLHCYPAAFRHEYGSQMLLVFSEQLGEARRTGGRTRQAGLWMRTALDALTVAPQEHSHVILQDLRYALRSIAASPSFAAVAVLSLALGIGANTAIFSLWNGLLHALLPMVAKPDQLVILTNPDMTGAWNGTLNGERPWLSPDEFEQLRTHADAFSSLMAVQSFADTWQVRSAQGDWEPANGRLVSAGFFDVLGVRPALGRVFTGSSIAPAPEAVIGYNYWQRRFAGRADALGKTIALRNLTLTVIGVTPAGFIGETADRQPDLWVPLSLQPLVRPGPDSLHDTFPNRNMWLNVFGRLKPGITQAQAEAQANAIFKAGLASFYGPAAPAQRADALSQFLRIHPAARGVSAARNVFSNVLTVLLAAVGVLLLIACANLANLLLARGAARRPELALRVSLGASRGRLVRQLMTESLLLALIGGLASLIAAYLLRGALAQMLPAQILPAKMPAPNLPLSFALDPLVLSFTLTVTVAAAILFGLLPAWQATRANDSGARMRRSQGGSRMRWGKSLVSLQLALSLPLLVGAGLLARTLYNVQHVDLGYRAQGLLLTHVDTDTAGYTTAQRNAFYRGLRDKLARTPGVEAASFSTLGLFSGTNLLLPIQAEAYTPAGKNTAVSPLDLVGPDYFATLGAPITRGRDILDSDDAGAPKVCVINQAFARFFFAGRNPIGMHVTVLAQQARVTYQVVGVSNDARTQNLRAQALPRVFLPWSQAPIEIGRGFLLVRAKGSAASIMPGTRRIIQHMDAGLPIDFLRGPDFLRSIDEQIAPLTALDRSTAQLAEVFGCAALLLAAIGLYGVLSYGVARRRSEIAIRVALGAQAGRVIAMVLGDTAWLLAAGLALGSGLAYAASRLIRSRLFGVAPQDPATLAAAVGLLLAVALSAAYLPARRAASLDPITALRQE